MDQGKRSPKNNMTATPLFGRRGILTVLILSGLFSACVSIKPSTVALSAELGSRLSEMEKIHLIALQRYFDVEQKRIEDFLTNTWEPLFLKNFLASSQILTLLAEPSAINKNQELLVAGAVKLYLTDTSEASRAASDIVKLLGKERKGEEGIVKSVLTRYVEDSRLSKACSQVMAVLGSDDPARMILEFAEAAHQEMMMQRQEMLMPLQQAREEAMATLSAAYAELIRGQATITGRLEAAARRSTQQDQLLGAMGIKPITQEAAQKMSSISEKVTKALEQARELVDKKDNNLFGKIKRVFSLK